METIHRAFMAKWKKVPLLETYRQMAIRQQKKKDWAACGRWTTPVELQAALGTSRAHQDLDAKLEAVPSSNLGGDAAGGADAAREEAVEDGRKPALCPDCRSASSAN